MSATELTDWEAAPVGPAKAGVGREFLRYAGDNGHGEVQLEVMDGTGRHVRLVAPTHDLAVEVYKRVTVALDDAMNGGGDAFADLVRENQRLAESLADVQRALDEENHEATVLRGELEESRAEVERLVAMMTPDARPAGEGAPA